MPFVIHSGNGQVVGRNCNSPEKLRVRLTDGGGSPVVGQTVDWELISGVGAPSPASGVTDANGIAETTYQGGDTNSVTPEERYATSVVRASTSGESDVDFYATTINNIVSGGGGLDIMPNAVLVDPNGPFSHLIVGQAGQTLADYLQVQVAFWPAMDPVPYVGVELLEETTSPQASASGAQVLTDASGIALVDVTFGAEVGGGNSILKVGLSSYDQQSLCYWLMVLQARTAADPQILVYRNDAAGLMGTMLGWTGLAPIRVRVRDDTGAPAAAEAITFESVTVGAMEMVDADAVTDADGFAETFVLLGANTGEYKIKVTSMAVELLLPVIIYDALGQWTPTPEDPEDPATGLDPPPLGLLTYFRR